MMNRGSTAGTHPHHTAGEGSLCVRHLVDTEVHNLTNHSRPQRQPDLVVGLHPGKYDAPSAQTARRWQSRPICPLMLAQIEHGLRSNHDSGVDTAERSGQTPDKRRCHPLIVQTLRLSLMMAACSGQSCETDQCKE